ncbi:CBS domain-containing protein [Acidimicrobiaceae bacterium USS-CC1]|uniref:CBS domain-containing protein n=1 Tax=Acidiferrimicrobium australe TaxID=2664430 RepID=A0ABW9QWG8_9ACTN|nr:CBS domain-containing protein [Acidiferrimicrobium australe]
MSPRAACRLESLGFTAVYDYTAGKVDWLAAGRRTEGPGAATLRPGSVARTPVPTCSLDDTVGDARQRAAAVGEDRCVVVTDRGIVVGLLGRDALTGDDRAAARDVMREGPTTIRAHEDLAGLARRMHNRNVAKILVTDPDGRPLGLLHRSDADAAIDSEAKRDDR